MSASRWNSPSGALAKQSFRQPGTPGGVPVCGPLRGRAALAMAGGPIARAILRLLTKVKSADIPDPPIAIGDTLPERVARFA